MPYLNRISIIGYIAHPFFLDTTYNGDPKCKIRLVINQPIKTGGDHGWKKEPIWLNVSAVGKVAENLYRLADNGTLIYIEARFANFTYADPETQVKNTTTYLQLVSFQVLSGKKQDDSQTSMEFQPEEPNPDNSNQQSDTEIIDDADSDLPF